MFIHIEAGAYASGYGNSRVLIAAARNPQGPFKMIWAYRVHFVENLRSTSNGYNKGMTRDQGVMVDSDGTAYQFGSTEENRFMCISKLGPDYTTIEGIPRYASGGNQNEMLMEGYQNRMGVNFNWIFGNQREAPAPFVHYETLNMTMDGDGSYGLLAPVDSVKRYYAVTSYSSGWFPNPQGVYRTAKGGNYILGGKPHNKSSLVEPDRLAEGTGNNLAEDSVPSTDWQSGNGWVVTANDSGASGSTTTLLFGQAGDGSHVSKGFDGQTTHVFQLRYPAHPWGIVTYGDDGYIPLSLSDYADAQAYYAALDGLTGTYSKPVYGERTELDEPRKGRLVYGKYVYLSDSWDSPKNYDARYIWLPLRALPESETDSGTNGHRYGLRVRWMDQWRWQDFVYEVGPFKDCLSRDPTGEDIWNDAANDITPLAQYYEMLGDIQEYLKNAGKQISGSY
ncbi:MAG: hypothetical protein LBL20_03310 [Treponema sp.]|jgi:hypothetical protein|nr:hypothetical protein [Treponema sp.]